MPALLDRLDRHVLRAPDRPAFHLLKNGTTDDVSTMTFGELDHRADAVADALVDVARPGDRAILAVRPGLGFVAALIGTMRAGVTVVPAFPPFSRRGTERLLAVARDCDPALLLHDLPGGTVPAGAAEAAPAMRVLHLGDIPARAGGGAGARRACDGPSLIQYTSGSTT